LSKIKPELYEIRVAVHLSEKQAIVEDDEVMKYRANAKSTFVVETERG